MTSYAGEGFLTVSIFKQVYYPKMLDKDFCPPISKSGGVKEQSPVLHFSLQREYFFSKAQEERKGSVKDRTC